MKIEILSIALVDIQSGQHFYEQQQEGLGAYFLDSLFSDIDALLLYANSLLAQNCVIPAQAGIRLIKNLPRSGATSQFCPRTRKG